MYGIDMPDTDLDVQRHIADRHMLARRTRIPQGDAVHVPRRDGENYKS